MSSSVRSLRLQARSLYKELYYLGREYPDPNYPIHKKLHACFLSHVGADKAKLEQGIAKAQFIKRELETMYFLRKYRAMKGRYYDQ
ncbi:hypothetical protein ACM66B_004085 [Microbotryomycetes sp. NB124-2]